MVSAALFSQKLVNEYFLDKNFEMTKALSEPQA
jgi:hypothetical protein